MKKLAFLLPLLIANNAFAQVKTPEMLLPAGVDSLIFTNPYTGESGLARKGTIGATLLNIQALNTLLKNKPSMENDRLIQEIVAENIKLLPSLKVLGLFNAFSVDEWLSHETEQPGRCLLGILYLQHYPHEIGHANKLQLDHIYQHTANTYLKSAAKALL